MPDPVIQSVAKLSHEARILAMDAKGNYTSAEVDYIVRFSETITDLDNLEESALQATRTKALSTTIGNLVLKSVQIKERLAPSAFTVTATYGEKDSDESESGGGQGGGGADEESQAEMSFECSAESKHVTVANRQEIVWIASGETNYKKGMNLGNCIGWNGKSGDDSAISGCDTYTGTAVETWTKTMPYSRITTAKKIKWGNTVGCVNKAAWKGWPARCVMFMGASFSKETGSSKVQVSFHFAVGAPYEDIELDGAKLRVSKSPFDYVWALIDEANDQNHRRTPKTRAVVISEVAPEADFSVLGI